MDNKRHNTIILSNGKEIEFYGKHTGHYHPNDPETERKNWHYYLGDDGTIYHFRKEHLIACIEKNV